MHDSQHLSGVMSENSPKRFYGEVCRRHPEEAGLRYRSDNSCVVCSRERVKRSARRRGHRPTGRHRTQARKRAIKAGRNTYLGTACKVCKNRRRYLSGSCVACKRREREAETPLQRARRLKRVSDYGKRAVRALKILKELGLVLSEI
jgi:hypothetical protein